MLVYYYYRYIRYILVYGEYREYREYGGREVYLYGVHYYIYKVIRDYKTILRDSINLMNIAIAAGYLVK